VLVRTDDQAALQAAVRSVVTHSYPETEVRAVAAAGAPRPGAGWTDLAKLGALGLLIPEAAGGSGATIAEVAVVAEVLGEELTPVPYLESAVFSTQAVIAADEVGVPGLLGRLADGETILTYAVVEQRGWSSGSIATSAEKSGRGWRLHGVKRFVTNAAASDGYIVAAVTSAGPSLFLVASDDPGVARETQFTADETRPLSDLALDGANGTLVGAEGQGWELITAGRRAASVALAAEMVGISDRVLRLTVSYAGTRKQFARPIGSFQAVKHRCANMLSTSSAPGRRPSTPPGRRSPATRMPSWPRCWPWPCAVNRWTGVTRSAVQVHGGIGFTWEHAAQLYLKRAQADRLLLGSPAHHRRGIAALAGITE
jgi:alkylation response protein AidB-like acyl-CoA dehydrogenase